MSSHVSAFCSSLARILPDRSCSGFGGSGDFVPVVLLLQLQTKNKANTRAAHEKLSCPCHKYGNFHRSAYPEREASSCSSVRRGSRRIDARLSVLHAASTSTCASESGCRASLRSASSRACVLAKQTGCNNGRRCQMRMLRLPHSTERWYGFFHTHRVCSFTRNHSTANSVPVGFQQRAVVSS